MLWLGALPPHEPQPHLDGLERLVHRGEDAGREGVEVGLLLGAAPKLSQRLLRIVLLLWAPSTVFCPSDDCRQAAGT